MFKFAQTENWIFQNLFARLIDLCKNFQIFSFQIPENIFSKMLKALIVHNFLHFVMKSMQFVQEVK